ncbi:hypothetical protein FGG08_004081 [Glutinoglossum americanum]|uniref:Uncharacterized protein n=1 Tax=Glutinoglossum americanum TaxID=1670608 RepID=A0A9P8I9X3_9PEZI|nr:hypothetical protein FGG08_004081 [Glutinoglossum americanum]
MATISACTNCSQGEDVPQPQWPESCKYFVPGIMDSEYVRSLLRDDTKYLDPGSTQHQQIDYLGFTNAGEVNHQKLVSDPDREAQLNEMDNPAHGLRVFFIHQKRVYAIEKKPWKWNQISVTCRTWLDLLDRLMIPSSAIEVLYDNNGGYGSHISYCSADGPHACRPIQTHCAYHIWLKVGNYRSHEYFAYARHDFHSGRDLVLVLGTNGEIDAQQLATQFRGQFRVNLFSVLLALATSWSRQIEVHRWKLDSETVKLESRTGHSAFQFSNSELLTPEQLSLSKDITLTSIGIHCTARGASNMAGNFSFLLAQLGRYAALCAIPPGQQVSGQLKTHLGDALSQHLDQTNAQIAQMDELKLRVDAQWSIINSLIAQRDSRSSIDIAAATKADSELMRGITFTTMVFLPATFMATFFSMVFFHIGSKDHVHLVISKWIWLYPVCMIPLTVILALNYGQFTWLKPLLQASGILKRC